VPVHTFTKQKDWSQSKLQSDETPTRCCKPFAIREAEELLYDFAAPELK
jgi:hypothetical protein